MWHSQVRYCRRTLHRALTKKGSKSCELPSIFLVDPQGCGSKQGRFKRYNPDAEPHVHPSVCSTILIGVPFVCLCGP